MKIAIVGTGAIGSTFAFQLANVGHDVTVVARGARLAQLERDGAIVTTSGERAPVTVAAALDEHIPFDLVLVSVLAPQVAAVLPALRASAAQTIMFMFNTFEDLAPLRAAVGAERFTFGFPRGVFTLLEEGRIRATIRHGTTVNARAWADVFGSAGIPTVVDDDMQSWLRSHAALVAPLMSMSVVALVRQVGWREAARYADAFHAGVRIVRALGNDLRPRSTALLARLPRFVLTLLLFLMSRTQTIRDLGRLGTAEPRMLIDMMQAAIPELAAPLVAVRP
ncbi:MAG: ketopantoate reductase family protein [Sandaracinaceae bacterium]